MSVWCGREVRTCGCRPRCWLRSFRLGSSPGDPDQRRGPRFLPARSAAERRGAREAPAECSAAQCSGSRLLLFPAGPEVQLCTQQATRDGIPSLSESGFSHRRVSERAGCIPTSLLVPFLLSGPVLGPGRARWAVSQGCGQPGGSSAKPPYLRARVWVLSVAAVAQPVNACPALVSGEHLG